MRRTLNALVVLATLSGCAEDWTVTAPRATSALNAHTNVLFTRSFVDGVDNMVASCMPAPAVIGADTHTLDLTSDCSRREASEALLAHAETDRETWIERVGTYDLAMGMFTSLPMPNAFPPILRDGIHEAVRISSRDYLDDLPESLLSCEISADARLQAFREEGMANVCDYCGALFDDGVAAFRAAWCAQQTGDVRAQCQGAADDDPIWLGTWYPHQICTYYDDHFRGGWSAFDAQICADLPNQRRDALEIDGIDSAWVSHEGQPALRLRLDFADEQKVASLRIGAEGRCDGVIADVLDQWGPRGFPLLQTFLSTLGHAVSAGHYDVMLDDLEVDLFFMPTVVDGHLTVDVDAEVDLAGLRTEPPMDGLLTLDLAMQLAGMSTTSIARNVGDVLRDEVQRSAAPDALRDFLLGGVPAGDVLCDTFIQAHPDPAERRFGLHTAAPTYVPEADVRTAQWRFDPLRGAYVMIDPEPVEMIDPCAEPRVRVIYRH